MTMLATLKNLPRDARDTLFLLTVIAWLIAPQVSNLPVWCSSMAGAILLWRAAIAVRGHSLPSRWWLLLLLALATVGTWTTYRTILGRDAGVTFIVVLLALKTLELRAQRDAFVVFFLGFFTLLSNFFFSQSLLTAFAMLVGLLGLLTALVNSHMPVGRPPLSQAARTAGWMALLGAPIMAVLFVLFPRIAPLWGVPSDAMTGRSGLSASMRVGTMASLALDSSVAMRIRFEGATPPARALYFRGPVLSTFDGQEWRPLRSSFPSRFQPTAQLQVNGTAYRYQVTLEANNRPWIVVLDATPDKPAINGYTASMGADLQWTADRPMTDLVRYSAESFPDFRYGPLRAVAALQDYLDLPPNFDPRTRLLATELLRDPRALDGASALVDLVLERLRTGGYTYTLEPGVFGIHTADEFWFDRKEGFCEHIASSFVVLMRAMGVAARVVTGYQGGEVNNVDGFWTVRQSDAHAWAEVWIAGRGWLRVDPTSSVAPGRTGSLQRLVVPQGAMAQVLGAVSPALVLNLREAWEALNNRWNQWVLNYSQAKQLDLLRNIGFESPSWQDLSYALIGVIVLASIMGALWTLWERHRQDPWLRLLHQAGTRLKWMGVAVPATAPPRSIATQLSQHADLATSPITPALVDWLLRLEAWRYAPHDQRAKLSALRREFNQLPWPPRRT